MKILLTLGVAIVFSIGPRGGLFVSSAQADFVFHEDFSDRNVADGSPVTWVPFVEAPYDASSGDLLVRRSDVIENSGVIGVSDIDLLSAEVRGPEPRTWFDLNEDMAVDESDRSIWVKELAHTWFGDANLDGEFNSGDFVTVLGIGKYELDQYASWSDGDWNGDQRFDSSDFVVALSDGGFEKGPRPAATVPEPQSWGLLTVGLLFLFRKRKCDRRHNYTNQTGSERYSNCLQHRGVGRDLS